MNDYPAELRYKPIPTVSVMGMSSDVLSSIEKAMPFTIQEATRSVPMFRFVPTAAKDWSVPPRGDKDKLPEAQPDGILPSGWLTNMLHKIPFAVLFALDWDSPDWKVKEWDNLMLIELLKQSTKVRSVNFFVLVFKKEPFAPNDERLAGLRRKSQMDNKNVISFIKDDFGPSVMMLETALKRALLDFYTEEIKAVKKRKEKMTKSIHGKLLARASFKIAFYSEMCNDYNGALKYYVAAYGHLRDTKKTWKDIDEVKVVAEVVNFRLCYLHLERNNHALATTQFQQHVSHYRTLTGDPEREYQHWAWVSRQYQVFGELLQLFASMAPPPTNVISYSSSSTASTSLQSPTRPRGVTHPGFYFQGAANFELQRRQCALRLCSPQKQKDGIQKLMAYLKPFKPSVIDVSKNTYIGQRVIIGALDAEKTMGLGDKQTALLPAVVDAITANSYEVAVTQELLVNHSTLIMNLLNTALDQYRMDHAPTDRTLWHLFGQLSQESFMTGNFLEAKAHSDQIIPHYRREKWFGLLAPFIRINYLCAMQLRSWYEVAKSGLEVLSPQIPMSQDDKKDILNTLTLIISAHRSSESTIKSLSMIASNSLTKLLESRNQLSGGDIDECETPTTATSDHLIDKPILCNQNSPASALIKCNVQFEQSSVVVHSEATLCVTLTSLLPASVRFDTLQVLFTDPELNQVLTDVQAITLPSPSIPVTILKSQELFNDSSTLFFLPNKPKTFRFPIVFHKVATVQCTGTILTLGGLPSAIQFQWDWTPLLQTSALSSTNLLRLTQPVHSRKTMDKSSIEILEVEPKISAELHHFAPALSGERYPITISIKNQGEPILKGLIRITNQSLTLLPSLNTPTSPKGSLKLPPHTATGTISSSNFFEHPYGSREGSSAYEVPFNGIDAGASHQITIFFLSPKAAVADDLKFKIKISYDTTIYSTSKELPLTIQVRNPFSISCDILGEDFSLLKPQDMSFLHKKDHSTELIPVPAPIPGTSDSTLQLSVNASTVPVGSKFYMRAELQNISSFPLTIHAIELQPTHHSPSYIPLNRSANAASRGLPADLETTNKYSVWLAFNASAPACHSLGNIKIDWSRTLVDNEDSSTEARTSWTPSAPVVYCEAPQFTTRLVCPEKASIGTPVEQQLVIRNLSASILYVAIEVDDSPSFAISGDKRAQYKLNRGSDFIATHTLVPLKVGVHVSPTIRLKQLGADGSGLNQNGVIEWPYQILSHPSIFVDPPTQGPLLYNRSS